MGGLFTGKLALARTVVAPDKRGNPLQPMHIHEARFLYLPVGSISLSFRLLPASMHGCAAGLTDVQAMRRLKPLNHSITDYCRLRGNVHHL